MNTYGDPSGSSLAYVTLVGILIFVITFIFLEALYYKALNDERQVKVVDRPVVELERMRADNLADLNDYGVEANYEASSTRISIPIERAMQLVIEEGEAALRGNPDAATGGATSSATRENTNQPTANESDAG